MLKSLQEMSNEFRKLAERGPEYAMDNSYCDYLPNIIELLQMLPGRGEYENDIRAWGRNAAWRGIGDSRRQLLDFGKYIDFGTALGERGGETVLFPDMALVEPHHRASDEAHRVHLYTMGLHFWEQWGLLRHHKAHAYEGGDAQACKVQDKRRLQPA